MNDIQQKLLTKIKSGELQMRPRWHFVLRAILWASATIVVALVTIYLFSFLLFVLHKSGLLFAPLLGWSGIMLFVISSPWLLVLVVGIFLTALYLLVTHYSFSYKQPLVYSLIVVVLAVIGVSSLIHQSKLHDRAGTILQERKVPGLGAVYQSVDSRPVDNVHAGVVITADEKIIVLQKLDGTSVEVLITERTKLPRNKIFTADEKIIVFGRNNDGTIEAIGIRPADERFLEGREIMNERPLEKMPPRNR